MTRKSTNTLIDEEFAKLRNRPRDAEEGIGISERDWCVRAKTALTIGKDDDLLKEVFAATDLDPTNPFHWAVLARSFATLRFGSRKAGRRQRWTTEELCRLVKAAYQIKKEHPKWSDLRICEKLVGDHELYKKLSAQTLRRRFQDALSGEDNELVRHVFTSGQANDWLERRRRAGRGMKGIVSVREFMLYELMETIISGWRKLERKLAKTYRSVK